MSTIAKQASTPSTSSEINFHRGNTLLKLANTYPKLSLTVIETIQNAIDGEADRIFVGIDMKNRRMNVADNGTGVDIFTFEQALNSVGQTIKSKGKLGRFGLGLISPLNKCRSFTFISAPMSGPSRSSTRWSFEQRKIATQHERLEIPREQFAGLPKVNREFRGFLKDGFDVQYRTLVSMNGITEDKVTSLIDLDELEGEMLSKLGQAMRTKHVKVLVVLIDDQGRTLQREITASDYAGEKLPEVHYHDPAAGDVAISLYRAPRLKGKRQGLVSVSEMHNPASISIQDFARQARMSKSKDDLKPALAALTSGFFEGVIMATNIEIHPERTKFQNNDALHGLYATLWYWYEEHGKEQFASEQDETRANRYQDLGLKSQDRLKSLFQTPAGRNLLATLHAHIKFGRLGDGHVTPLSGRITKDKDSIPGVRSGQGGAGKPRGKGGKTSHPRPTSSGPDRPGDTPLGVLGPRGTRRTLVRGDSEGIWYEHSDLPGNSRLWEFDVEVGILTFNVRHPLWERLDMDKGKHSAKNARQIMHLQEWLTLQVLNLLAVYPEDLEEHRSLIDDQIKPYIELFIAASSTTR